MVKFATWLCEKLKANRKASLRIEGKAVAPNIDEVVEALNELSRRSRISQKGRSEAHSTITAQDMGALATYLHTRLEYIQSCNAEIENHLSDEQIAIANSGVLRSDLDRAFFDLDHVIGNTFRYSMLIAVSAFLEDSLVVICQIRIPDYSSKLGEPKANWFSRHRRMLETEAGVCFDRVAEECETIDALVVVRNCLAHAWGRISNCRNADRLRTIINKYDYFEEYADSHLYVGDDAVPSMIWAAEKILDHVLEEAAGV